MSDLRKAAKMVLEILETDQSQLHWQAVRTLRQALAQPEQEPVAWMFKHKETGNLTFFDSKATAYWFAKDNDRWESIPLYTALPKREWKGLTPDDKHFLLANAWNKEQAFDGFMDAIDMFLKEKNT